MRGIPTILTLGLLTQGCVIYEEHYVGDTACLPDADGAPRPGSDGTYDEPDPDPEPIVLDLFLSDDDGEPGEVLLSTLLSGDASFDLRRIAAVSFEHSVTVNDAMVREDEVVLLLAVDAAATPGLVDGFVTLDDGTVGLIASPFEVLEVSGGLNGGGNGGNGGTDTGVGTGGGGNGGTGGNGSTGGNDTGTSTSGGTDTGSTSGHQCPPMSDTSDTGC